MDGLALGELDRREQNQLYFAGLRKQMQICRMRGRHAWKEPYQVDRRPAGGTRAFERCTCGLEQHVDRNRRGIIIGKKTYYKELPGYLRPRGSGRIDAETRGDFWLEVLGRLRARAK